MKNIIKLVSISLILVLFFACAKKQEEKAQKKVAEEKETLIIGHVPSSNPVEILQRYKKLKKYLERRLNINIEFKFAASYSEIIENLNKGKYDLVIFGPFSYIEANKLTGCQAILKPIRYGSTSYKGMIIARTESKINTIADLRNKTFAFVDPKSTSGYLFIKALLKENNIDIDKDLKDYEFLKNHKNVVYSVYNGKKDAGACYVDARKNIFKEKEKVEELKIIAETKAIPNEPIACSRKMIEKRKELLEKIKKEFLNIKKSNTSVKLILKSLGEGIDGYIEAKDSDYDVVRAAAQHLDADEKF